MSPANLEQAYNLPVHGGANRMVAVLEDGDNPNLEHDLAIFREWYGLSPCTKSNRCLEVVSSTGSTANLDPVVSETLGESAMDVQVVSAICPDCRIMVVEVDTSNIDWNNVNPYVWLVDFGQAAQEAMHLGASAISISYAVGDFLTSQELAAVGYQFAFPYPDTGVITGSSGDTGFNGGQTELGYAMSGAAPGDLPGVTSVGGTSLASDPSSVRGYDESVWVDGGSGCSYSVPAPSYQVTNYCTGAAVGAAAGNRESPDISFAADPLGGGMAYYMTPPGDLNVLNQSFWQVGGGTSQSAPAIAALYMLDSTPGVSTPPLSRLYARFLAGPQDFFAPPGSNGTNCAPIFLCTNYGLGQGPVGLGSPNGIHAFDP